MRNGDKQSEVTKLKREIIKLLYSNPEIIEILDNEQVALTAQIPLNGFVFSRM